MRANRAECTQHNNKDLRNRSPDRSHRMQTLKLLFTFSFLFPPGAALAEPPAERSFSPLRRHSSVHSPSEDAWRRRKKDENRAAIDKRQRNQNKRFRVVYIHFSSLDRSLIAAGHSEPLAGLILMRSVKHSLFVCFFYFIIFCCY